MLAGRPRALCPGGAGARREKRRPQPAGVTHQPGGAAGSLRAGLLGQRELGPDDPSRSVGEGGGITTSRWQRGSRTGPQRVVRAEREQGASGAGRRKPAVCAAGGGRA